MKIGIIGAMPEEVAGILAELEDASTEEIGRRIYSSGRWHGIEVVLVYSRIGKVAAASVATTLLDRFLVEGILFIGVAGSADPALRMGDVVIGATLVQHDMDASALPMFARFEIPLLGRTHFPAPPSWVEAAHRATELYLRDGFAAEIDRDTREDFGLHQPAVHTGLIASGDQFVTEARVVAELRGVLPDLLAIEMEGAAVAQVCHEFDRPLLVVRVISDSADDSAVVDFQRFVALVATPMTLGIAARVLPILAR